MSLNIFAGYHPKFLTGFEVLLVCSFLSDVAISNKFFTKHSNLEIESLKRAWRL